MTQQDKKFQKKKKREAKKARDLERSSHKLEANVVEKEKAHGRNLLILIGGIIIAASIFIFSRMD